MSLKKLMRKEIEPRCVYCANGTPLADGDTMTCRKKGVVAASSSCRAFRYDPLRRTPPKPATLRGGYSADDFSLEEGGSK